MRALLGCAVFLGAACASLSTEAEDLWRCVALSRVGRECGSPNSGVAALLAKYNGRRAWRVQDGSCVPATPDGRQVGFRVIQTQP